MGGPFKLTILDDYPINYLVFLRIGPRLSSTGQGIMHPTILFSGNSIIKGDSPYPKALSSSFRVTGLDSRRDGVFVTSPCSVPRSDPNSKTDADGGVGASFEVTSLAVSSLMLSITFRVRGTPTYRRGLATVILFKGISLMRNEFRNLTLESSEPLNYGSKRCQTGNI